MLKVIKGDFFPETSQTITQGLVDHVWSTDHRLETSGLDGPLHYNATLRTDCAYTLWAFSKMEAKYIHP